jgi:hypothetical protein
MLKEIPDNFCGYVGIDDVPFIFNLTGHTVKLLPEYSNKKEGFNALMKNGHNHPEFLYGHCEKNYNIAFLRKTDFSTPFPGSAASFSSPLIVMDTSNTGYHDKIFGEWHKFDAISFSGGIINEIFNPKMAALRMMTAEEAMSFSKEFNGAHTIEIKPFEEYTYTCDVVLGDICAKLVFSVYHDGESNDVSKNSLGNLISFIRLEFEDTLQLDSIEKIYVTIKSLVAILTVAHNSAFDCKLHQRNADSRFCNTGLCKAYHNHDELTKRSHRNVIPLDILKEHLPSLVKAIYDGEADTLLDLLPSNNSPYINIADIQDLCTALEVAYNLSGHKNERDNMIKTLKRALNDTIKQFSDENDIKIRDQTTIRSSFKYLDWNARDKVMYLYQKHSEIVDAISQKSRSPLIDVENVKDFLHLRNSKAHEGKIDWGDSAEIYAPLLALVYTSFFSRIGTPTSEIKAALLRIF